MTQDDQEQIYTDWYADQEDVLKSDFLEQKSHEDLRDFLLLEEEETIFEFYERGFEDFCSEQFNNHCREVYEE